MEIKDDNSNIIVNVQNLSDETWTIDGQLDMDALPVLPTRDAVIFPMSTVPLSLGRENSLLTARAAAEDNICLLYTSDAADE